MHSPNLEQRDMADFTKQAQPQSFLAFFYQGVNTRI